MGIVNLTDDSYFAESRCPSVDAAMLRVERLLTEGADIIDIGACSTRPGSEPVGAEVEWQRLEPVLGKLSENFPGAVVSIDTYWASVVENAYNLIGDFIVNDISSGEDDPAMLPVVGKLGLSYVAMHKRGTPKTMQELTDYNSVVDDVADYFVQFSKNASLNGIRKWILDPGFGFAKTVGQNYDLLREMHRLKSLAGLSGEQPRILIGVSRKSMIFKKFGLAPEDILPETQVVHFKALQMGADILRVHDVAEAKRTVELYRTLG